jgi:hypothetical protein
MGGTYWDSEEPDYRDVRLGFDPNDVLKKDILRDLLDRLSRDHLLSTKAKKLGPLDEMISKLTHKRKLKSKEKNGCLTNSMVMDVTEYGRVVHAEMCAICDAARIGKSVKGTTLYCTTFAPRERWSLGECLFFPFVPAQAGTQGKIPRRRLLGSGCPLSRARTENVARAANSLPSPTREEGRQDAALPAAISVGDTLGILFGRLYI